MIIILEGVDGSGKTTAANALSQKYNLDIIHNGPLLDLDSESLFEHYAHQILKFDNVVIDRSWSSELIYSKCYRNTQSRITFEQELELYRLCLDKNVKLLFCNTSFFNIEKSYLNRQSEEYVSKLEKIKNIYDEYNDKLKNWKTFDYEKQSIFECI